MNRIIIAGASSSSGKTTITCGLLSALRKRGLKVCAYKTGPDYIDPQYLRQAGKCEAYNLDTWLMSEDLTQKLFAMTSAGHDLAIIEGAMGLYDGGKNSTAGIAELLRAPVVLIVNAKSLGESAAAAALGFREFNHEINIAGVILNCTGSSSHVKIIAKALERTGIKFLGALSRNNKIAIPERHLGLLPELENEEFDFEALSSEVENNIDVDEILRIAESALALQPSSKIQPEIKRKARAAIAHDQAFSFYYPESLDVLKLYGAELIFFSPLHDANLPEAEAYIFGGGFPEIFARELAENTSMLESLRRCTGKIYAECGGLMYLCKSLTNLKREKFKMAGLLPFDSFMTQRPAIGYIEAKSLKDNILCEQGKIIRGHEFHYSRIEPEYNKESCAFELFRRRTGKLYYGGYSSGKILASYLHVNFFGYPELAENLLTSSQV